MSIEAVEWALEQEGLSTPEKMILVVLAEAYREGAGCWPSVATIQRKASVSRSTAFKVLASLENKGLIARIPRIERGRASNVYFLMIDTETEMDADTVHEPDFRRPRAGRTAVHEADPEPINKNHNRTIRESAHAREAEKDGKEGAAAMDETTPTILSNDVQEPTRRRTRRKATKWRESDKVPADWIREEAAAHGISIRQVATWARSFEGYWADKGKPMRNWRLTFKRWIANDVGRLIATGWKPSGGPKQPEQPSLLDGVSEIGGKPMTEERRKAFELWRRSREVGLTSRDCFDETYCPPIEKTS